MPLATLIQAPKDKKKTNLAIPAPTQPQAHIKRYLGTHIQAVHPAALPSTLASCGKWTHLFKSRYQCECGR